MLFFTKFEILSYFRLDIDMYIKVSLGVHQKRQAFTHNLIAAWDFGVENFLIILSLISALSSSEPSRQPPPLLRTPYKHLSFFVSLFHS
jgi:hypothetical protein